MGMDPIGDQHIKEGKGDVKQFKKMMFSKVADPTFQQGVKKLAPIIDLRKRFYKDVITEMNENFKSQNWEAPEEVKAENLRLKNYRLRKAKPCGFKL